MGRKSEKLFDRARDEVFSLIQHCGVLQASEKDQAEWLQDTMDYMADRYAQLSAPELERIELLCRRYIAPAVPHGKGKTALNRDEWASDAGADVSEADSGEPVAHEHREDASLVGA